MAEILDVFDVIVGGLGFEDCSGHGMPP